MSKFTEAAARSQTMSLAAMEEASRFGLRTADIEHMLLALTLNEETAGQVLRSLGVTLEPTRNAVAAHHREQLATLGIVAQAPEQGSIVFHETGGYEWSERALLLITRAGGGTLQGDSSAVLRELVSEPSGTVAAVLQQLNTSPDAVLSALDEAERYPDHAPARRINPRTLSGQTVTFVAAPVEQVWALLSNPMRIPDWDQNVARVECTDPTAAVGESWIAHTRTEHAGGKTAKVRPEFMRSEVQLLTREELQTLEFRYRYPDAPKANTRRIRIDIEPVAGGTQLSLLFAWERSANRRLRPLRAFALRPAYRFIIWMQLLTLSSGISRAFR